MSRRRFPNPGRILALSFLLALRALAADPAGPEAGAALDQLRAARADLDLDACNDFRLEDRIEDEAGGVHLRVQQTYRGLKVWGGQAILHLDGRGGADPMDDALVRTIRLETTANLSLAEALAVARERISPRGGFTVPPSAELVVWPVPAPREAGPDGPEPAAAPLGHRLAYHVHLELENGRDETRHEDLLVDAHTGAVLKVWSTLFTARGKAARTPGQSQYSGAVTLDVLEQGGRFELKDPTRGGLATRNLGGRTDGPGKPFLSAGPTWGDGLNYDPGLGPGSVNGETAAVDAHFGLQKSWDFYRNVLRRDGIDGRGRGPVNRVHYGSGYGNAFWADDCFCMTYGDGVEGPYTSLDVVGHEVAHGLCHATAGLGYDGEAGGLNEANSDIFGVLLNFYVRGAGGTGDQVPDQGASWGLGTELFGAPFRHLDQPSLDGSSADEWSPELEELDPHFSSGPMNRAFYFLSQGASRDPRSRGYSPRLPTGMKGVGNTKAIRIWWRTLSTRLTPESGYREARIGALQAARELYGPRSYAVKAVALAFHGVNVGPAPK